MLGMDGLDLNQLTESERDQILSVLGRDDELKRKEQERIRRLRNDVKRLRLKGVIREGQNADRSCARCRQPFGWIFNKGAVCSSCQHRVCDKCRVTRDSATAAVTAPGSGGGESWLCVLCHKQMELEAMTNHWFYSKFRKSKRSKKTNQVISGADIIKTSFRRSTRPQYGKRDSRPESDQNLPSTSAPTIVAPPVSLQKENDARVVEATSSVQSCSDLQGTPSQGEGHTTDPEGHVTITAAAPSVEQDPASVSNGHLAPPSPRAAPSSPTSSPARSSGSRRSQEPSRDTARGADQSPHRVKRDQSPRGSSPQAASPRRASPHHTGASPHHTGASPLHTGASPLHTGSSPSGSSARDSSPRGTIRDSPRSQKSGKSAASSHEEDNLDELFASHLSVNSHSDSTKRGSNLLSPFSTSRESILSFYSDAGEVNYGKIPVSGDILLGLDYNYKNNVFEVHVKQCRDLAPVDAKRKRSDPYVKTYLLPDKTKSGKRKTRVKKHTLSPTFDETLRYQITKSELENRALWLTVWHNDSFGRNDFLGEVNIGMDDYMFTNNTPQWYRLMDRQANPPASLAYKGDLVVSLKFVTSDNLLSKKRARSGERGELHVLVKEARNLTAVRANGSSDPFCKAYLLPEKTKNAKQKTSVKKRDVNPRWNHTFVFEDIARADLPERALELTVWDHDRFTSNDYLGGVRLGTGRGTSGGKEVDWMDSQGEEISLWTSMLDRPNCWIEGTLLLRASMSSRL